MEDFGEGIEKVEISAGETEREETAEGARSESPSDGIRGEEGSGSGALTRTGERKAAGAADSGAAED